VGTFGLGSAAYHWSREAAGISRAIHYLLSGEEFWQLLYVDDFLWFAQGANMQANLLMVVLFLEVINLPMSWKKFKGGHEQEWIGFWVTIPLRGVGISQARARWLCEWIGRTLITRLVNVGEFAQVLGRLSFAMSALDYFRPFLGPLFAWTAAMSKFSLLKIPEAISMILSFLSDRLSVQSGQVLGVGPDPETCRHREFYRSDAKAEGEDVCLGGWECKHGVPPGKARWFSEVITRSGSPWVFAAGESYRAIASLELLATLCCLLAFDVDASSSGSNICGAGTDNLGNRFVVSKLMTTKFPLVIVLMEIAAVLQSKGTHLELHWLPRLQNSEADCLTNQDFTQFDPALRVRVNIEEYQGIVMRKMMSAGMDLYTEIRAAKVSKIESKLKRLSPTDAQPVSSAKKGRTNLRETDPWQ
jgi:hypothetical protein